MRSFLLVSAMLFAGTAAYPAQTIEQACLKSGRKAASRSLCGCVQKVADMTLSRSDQRKAVKFFADPQEAQDIRASGLFETVEIEPRGSTLVVRVEEFPTTTTRHFLIGKQPSLAP